MCCIHFDDTPKDLDTANVLETVKHVRHVENRVFYYVLGVFWCAFRDLCCRSRGSELMNIDTFINFLSHFAAAP